MTTGSTSLLETELDPGQPIHALTVRGVGT